MAEYAAGISDWAARITSDSWAVSPTVVYGTMYANAFFEKDMRKLIEGSIEFLPEGDRYKDIVRECLALYDKYPTDWYPARQEIAKKYWHEENTFSKTIWNAALNGAMAGDIIGSFQQDRQFGERAFSFFPGPGRVIEQNGHSQSLCIARDPGTHIAHSDDPQNFSLQGFPEGTVDVEWTEDGAVTVTVTACRDMDTSLLLLGRETCRVALTAGESKTLRLAR